MPRGGVRVLRLPGSGGGKVRRFPVLPPIALYRELIVTSLPGETRMALIEDGQVVELGVECRTEQSVLHGIYRARVQRVVPGTQSAFLDLGLHRNAFLQVDQIPLRALAGGSARRRAGRPQPSGSGSLAASREMGTTSTGEPTSEAHRGTSPAGVEDLLRVGQTVLVQVVREPLGPKGYKVSCDLNLQGRFFDFRPVAARRVITPRAALGPRERLRIAALVERQATLDGQWVARPSAEQRDETMLAADMARLEADWTQIRREGASGPPKCLRAEVPMVFRYIRDVLSSGFSVIRVDSEKLYGRLVNFVRQFLPGMEHKVRYYSRNYPIFDEYGVEAAFEQAARRRVRLPSGGSIVIDETEALVAVDVNTGSFVGDGIEREETNTLTNLEAAAEAARQLRLRGLGGIIVVDFIDMQQGRNRDRVFRALQARLRRDPAFTRVSPPEPRAGLVVVTRKRERASLETGLFSSCPACGGVGKVRSSAAACQDVLTRARKRAATFRSGLLIRAAPLLASALSRSAVPGEIRQVIAAPVQVEEAPTLPEPRFRLIALDEAETAERRSPVASSPSIEAASMKLSASPAPATLPEPPS